MSLVSNRSLYGSFDIDIAPAGVLFGHLDSFCSNDFYKVNIGVLFLTFSQLHDRMGYCM